MLFATPGMLHGGTSLEVFKAWAPDPKNLVLLPSYQVTSAADTQHCFQLHAAYLVLPAARSLCGLPLSSCATQENAKCMHLALACLAMENRTPANLVTWLIFTTSARPNMGFCDLNSAMVLVSQVAGTVGRKLMMGVRQGLQIDAKTRLDVRCKVRLLCCVLLRAHLTAVGRCKNSCMQACLLQHCGSRVPGWSC